MYPIYQNPTFPNYNPPQFPPQTNTNPRLVVKQVGSIEEAKGAIIDPFSLFLFVDFATGKIYVKKMGDNGQSEFYSYSQEATPKPVNPMDEIRERLANIEAHLGGSYDKSIPDATGSKKSDSGNHKSADGTNEAE